MAVIVGEMFFSGISGSTTADVSAMSSMLLPSMKRAGYPQEQSVAIISASSAMGILIPPCITMVVFAGVTNTSVAALFLAGFLPALVLAILTADCLPVVLTDTHGRVLGVAHAGWRGLAGGVLEATLAALKARAPQAQWRAWIGPAIGPSAFEVGADVLAAFPGATSFFVPREGHPGKWWCNLAGLARARLGAAGVEDITCSDLCTVTDARFYSYRRDGQTGRIATLAWLQTPGE